MRVLLNPVNPSRLRTPLRLSPLHRTPHMTLLESIARAAAEADDGKLSAQSNFPIVLNSDAILPNLKPNTDAPPSAVAPLIKRVAGWAILETDSEIADLSAKLSKSLNRKLKNPRSLSRDDFLSLLNSFLTKNADKIRLPIGSSPSDPGFTCAAIEKLGFLMSQEVARPIAECCLHLELWEVVESLVLQGLIGNLNATSLIAKLVERSRPKLLCLCVERIPDLRSSDLFSILKCFLSPSDDCYGNMVAVRKLWENQALLAIEKATQKGVPKKLAHLAKEASILLMMAHDGFISPELCLHYVFGSSNLDGLVLASAVSRLDGSEVLRLVRYFVKWLEKYQSFPEAVPCPSAGSKLGLRACESIPSLEAVVSGLGLVLDEHYSYLVLNSKFHDEIRAMERVVGILASEAASCCPVDDIIKRLQMEAGQHGGVQSLSQLIIMSGMPLH